MFSFHSLDFIKINLSFSMIIYGFLGYLSNGMVASCKLCVYDCARAAAAMEPLAFEWTLSDSFRDDCPDSVQFHSFVVQHLSQPRLVLYRHTLICLAIAIVNSRETGPELG